MTSGLDAFTSGEIFRKDRKIIIAQNRHQAAIVPVRLQYDATGYKAGQTIARNTTSGVWTKYATSGASGTDTAVGILMGDVQEMSLNKSDLGQLIVKGQLFEAACLDLDAAAKVDLGARSVVDGSGTTILMF